MKLLCVAPELVRQALPLADRYIRTAIESVAISEPEDAFANVIEGRALLWMVVDGEKIVGAVVTELQVFKGRKTCVIIAYGSDDHTGCGHLITNLEAFARAEKCAAIRLNGRKGWMRRLPDYSVKAVIMEKAL